MMRQSEKRGQTVEGGVGEAPTFGRSDSGGEAGLVIDQAGVAFQAVRGGEQFWAVSEVSLKIRAEEFCCVVGPSGCGKSSLLLAVGGLIPLARGRVMINNDVIRGPGRDRAIVFQSASLFPWRSVLGNVVYGLEMRKVPKADAQELARKAIALVGLEGFELHYPRELSGGMQQRVNLARALVVDPKIFLMDEPFAALDAQTREVMQAELLRIWGRFRKSVMFVTHQIEEAVYLGDKVVVLTKGPGSRVAEMIDVPFERPRGEGLKRSPEFLHIVDRIWAQIRSGN